jgi:hypothetical protein
MARSFEVFAGHAELAGGTGDGQGAYIVAERMQPASDPTPHRAERSSAHNGHNSLVSE